MRPTEHDEFFDKLIPQLEAEHDAEPNPEYRDLIWKLIGSVEEYLLMRDAKRREES